MVVASSHTLCYDGDGIALTGQQRCTPAAAVHLGAPFWSSHFLRATGTSAWTLVLYGLQTREHGEVKKITHFRNQMKQHSSRWITSSLGQTSATSSSSLSHCSNGHFLAAVFNLPGSAWWDLKPLAAVTRQHDEAQTQWRGHWSLPRVCHAGQQRLQDHVWKNCQHLYNKPQV